MPATLDRHERIQRRLKVAIAVTLSLLLVLLVVYIRAAILVSRFVRIESVTSGVDSDAKR
ncbi:MAG TPA: hypothetical protein VKT78_09290 [Fimbriimonadaceae bacterium]|nr:hypothetical protein [Fimbriimonadaceae bacterium]